MFEPTLASVRAHQLPAWYEDAKLGIFVHWGLYSVPAWAPLTGELGTVVAESGWLKWFSEQSVCRVVSELARNRPGRHTRSSCQNLRRRFQIRGFRPAVRRRGQPV